MSAVICPTPARRSWHRVSCAALVAGLLLGACGSGDERPVAGGDAGVAPIGEVPETLTARTSPTVPDLVAAATTTTSPPRPLTSPLGDDVDGKYVLLIGDDVLAETAVRNDGIACEVLTGFGWDVEVAAEPGRFVDFVGEVLDARLPDDPSVIGIMLGHWFEGSLDAYRNRLVEAVEAAEGRPVILYTIAGTYTTDDPAADATTESVNRVIESLARGFPNVVVVDWNDAAISEPDVLLDDGGPTPTADGAGRIVVLTADMLGDAPSGSDEPGACIESTFTSDDAIII